MTFITNTKYECERSRNKDLKRAQRRVNTAFAPRGPVYVNRMEKPIVPEFELEKRRNSLFGKIGAFFDSIIPSLNPEDMDDANIVFDISSGTINEGDIALLRSLKDSAVLYKNEEEAQAALERKKGKKGKKHSDRRKNKTIQITPKDNPKPEIPSIIDIKDTVESRARINNDRRNETIQIISEYLETMPDIGAFKLVSTEVLDSFTTAELEDLLTQIRTFTWQQNLRGGEVKKKVWTETEEYLLFSSGINIKDFLIMLDNSRKEIIDDTEMTGLIDWANHENASSKAGFRYGNDIVHNWNVTNLKLAIKEAYAISCEDAGKLDHDPVLEFPNGEKVRLSKFIGKENFAEIADADAIGKDMPPVEVASNVLKTA